METIKFRIYDKQQNKMIESGATPMMLKSFFEHTAVLHTRDEMPYLQFTGVLDKQGKEIYEGDIIIVDFGNPIKREIPKPKKAEVIFEKGSFVIYLRYDANEKILFNNINNDFLEVIGNI